MAQSASSAGAGALGDKDVVEGAAGYQRQKGDVMRRTYIPSTFLVQ